MSEWISVEDGLPENRNIVLLYSNKRGFRIGYFNGELWVTIDYEALRQNTVTHWMPLPTPPKESR